MEYRHGDTFIKVEGSDDFGRFLRDIEKLREEAGKRTEPPSSAMKTGDSWIRSRS
jgi:hypothetical protein